MSMTDPLADLLTRIRNAQMARHEKVDIPYSKGKEKVVRILRDEGYIAAYTKVDAQPFGHLSVVLKYGPDRVPAIERVARVSRPGRRVYAGHKDIPVVLGGMGINILSTSRGFMTGKKAAETGIGGEIICEVQ